jgi:predicted transcriptional regulator
MTTDLLEMSVNLVTAHLTQNRMEARDVPGFIREIHATLSALQQEQNITTASSVAVQPPPAADAIVVPDAAVAPLASVAHQTDSSGYKNSPVDMVAVKPDDAAAAQMQVASETNQSEQGASNKIAYTRDNNLDDPVFAGLDPWLAARISPNVARKLDAENPLHPSVYQNFIICLEDGQQVTLLRPHIKKRYGLTESEYKVKWNLPDNYPMAPPEYLAQKRKQALKGGLGRSVRARREKLRPESTTEKPSKRSQGSKTVEATSPLDEISSKPRDTREAKARGAGSRRKLTLFATEGSAA